MAIKAFYAWQSDRSSKLNRNFIRAALDGAASDIGSDMELDDALRDFEIDQDTQGVPGSPPIAETILAKIEASDLFVADLTFANDPGDAGRQAPNPNVMLEYGYALHALGDRRMIGVFNDYFGPATDLPFDLVHRRWPIRYRLGPDDHADVRAAAKRQLRVDLVIALKAAMPSGPVVEAPPAFTPAEPADGIGSFVKPGNRFAVRPGVRPNEEGHFVALKKGSYAFLRLMPANAGEPLSNVEAEQLARKGLIPFAFVEGGFSFARNANGTVTYWVRNADLHTAWGATELFKTKELWGVDFFLLREREGMETSGSERFIPSVALEDRYGQGVGHYLDFARHKLKLDLPVRLALGLVGVEGMYLALDRNRYSDEAAGPILEDHITIELNVTDWDVDLGELIRPWFDKIYDAAGVSRI